MRKDMRWIGLAYKHVSLPLTRDNATLSAALAWLRAPWEAGAHCAGTAYRPPGTLGQLAERAALRRQPLGLQDFCRYLAIILDGEHQTKEFMERRNDVDISGCSCAFVEARFLRYTGARGDVQALRDC
jgi:hypothetical protein